MPRKVDKIIDKSTSRKVYMSTRNAQRWISLKDHLSFLTDDELLDYLFDLADSTIDQSSRENAESYKVRCIQVSDVQSRFVSSKDSRILRCNLPRSSSRKLILDDVTASARCEKSRNVPSSQNVEKINQQEHGACLKPCSKRTRRNKNKCRRNKLEMRKHQKIRMILKPDLGSDCIKQVLDLGEGVIHTSGNQVSRARKFSSVHDELQLAGNLENDAQGELETKIEEPSDSSHSLTVDVVNIDENLIEDTKVSSCEKLHDTCQEQESVNQSLSENDDENVEEGITSSMDVTGTHENNVTPYSQADNVISTVVDTVSNSKDTEENMLSSAIEVSENCNVEHFGDTLLEPLHVMEDSISFDNWKNKYKNNIQVTRAIELQDPMSRGYSNGTSYSFESNDQSRCKERYEEEQENIHPNWPLFSRESLPACLELKMTSMDHGLGVFAKLIVPMYTQFGPLIGQPIQEMDIPDDYSMKHIWEVSANDKTLYVSTTNPLESNWIRYIRPAESQNDKTVNVVKKNGQLFFVTCKTLTTGIELVYWLDSPSNSWTRKNKMDKTNCGGCNLKFSHPIYYRLHCCIFHDTNYSLTIRKYHCKVCGTAVLGKDNIMKHAAQFHAGRGAYQCQYCKKFFLRLNYLEMHRTYGCSKNPSRSRPLCDFCGRKFCQPQKLKVHIKRMHSNTSEVLEEFQCKLCSKLLGSRAALARHMKEVHQKDVIGAAACDRCGKTFQNKSNLKIHMLTHSGVKPFKCKENECRAAFTTKQCLQFHYKKVHGLSDEMMPKIERSIAYTLDAYSGGLVEDLGTGKIPKFSSDQKEECISSFDLEDECSDLSHDTVDLSSLRGLKKTCQTTIKDSSDKRESSTESLNTRQEECTTSEIHGKWTSKLDAESCATLGAETFNIDGTRSSGPSSDRTRSPCQISANDEKLEPSLCKRQESLNASLLVEAALDAAERDIGVVSIPSLEDNEQGSADLYSSVPSELGFKPVDYQVSHETSDLDSYVHDELVSSTTIPNSRQALPVCSQYRSNGYVASSNRLHSIEQYLEQDIAASPRYEEMVHLDSNSNSQVQSQPHRLTIDAASSDESDCAVQNLSLAVKTKSIMETWNYEPDYNSVSMAKVKFVVQGGAREQGLDMSVRGLQQTSEPQVQDGNHLQHYHHHHHHHHHHPFKMGENERQGVDSSISGPCVSPSYAPIYPPYSHVDVPRVVNLEPTSKSHQLHTAVSRIIASPLTETCPPLSPDGAQVRILPSSVSPIHTYNAATYSIGTAYHTPRSGYHYCNYY